MVEAGLPVSVVLSDRPCAALALAEEHGTAAELVDRNGYGGFGPGFDHDGFTATVATPWSPIRSTSWRWPDSGP